jgi:WD40 repeat protein
VTSPDERFVVSAEGDPSAPVFTLLATADGERVAAFPGWPGVTNWALAADASYLAILDGSRRGRLLDPRTGDLIAEFVHQRGLVRIVPASAESLLVTVDVDGAVIAWRAAVPDLDIKFTDSYYLGRTDNPSTLRVAPAAPTIVFDTAQRLVAMRSLTGREPTTFLGTAGPVGPTTMRFDDEAAYLVTANGPLLRLWRNEPGVRQDPVVFDLSALDVDAGGETVALGFHGGHARIRHAAELDPVEAGAQSVDYIGHRGMITRIAMNAERDVFATGGEDGVVRLWDLQSIAPNEFFLRHPTGPISALEISRDAQWLVSAADISARIWQVSTGRLVGEIPVNGTALAVAFSPRGEIAAVGDSTGNIFFGAWSEPLRSSRTRSAVRALAFTRDSQVMASGDAAGNLLLWDVVTGDPSRGAYAFAQAVTWIDFREDERSLLVGSGQWVHEVQIDTAGLRITESRMLPTELGADVVLTELEDGTIRAIGSPSSGVLTVYDFVMTGPVREPLPAASPELERDWSRILALEVERSSGAVRLTRQ